MSATIDVETFQEMFKVLEDRLKNSENEIRILKSEHKNCPSCGMRESRRARFKNRPFYDLSLSEAVMSILLEADAPMSIRTLKLRLLEKGYLEKQLGRYGNRLHTVVWRLSEGDAPQIKRLEGNELIAI
jgi:hypothetical protein